MDARSSIPIGYGYVFGSKGLHSGSGGTGIANAGDGGTGSMVVVFLGGRYCGAVYGVKDSVVVVVVVFGVSSTNMRL